MRDDENIGSISKFYFGASAERLSYTQFTASRTRFCPQARNLTHSSSTVPPLDYPPIFPRIQAGNRSTSAIFSALFSRLLGSLPVKYFSRLAGIVKTPEARDVIGRAEALYVSFKFRVQCLRGPVIALA